MTDSELWDYLHSRKMSHSRVLGKDFIWVPKDVFSSVQQYFKPEFNVFYPSGSMRSRGYFRHVHAVIQDDCVFVHLDTGNLARFFPLGIAHLFIDVLPFLIFTRMKGVSVHSLFVRPK